MTHKRVGSARFERKPPPPPPPPPEKCRCEKCRCEKCPRCGK